MRPPQRFILRAFVVLICLVIGAAVGFFLGRESADAEWTRSLRQVSETMRTLDGDIKAGRGSPRGAEYFLKLSPLLERFDGTSVTYYAGPYARHSVTIEFDESGVRGLSIDQPAPRAGGAAPASGPSK
jgi:hypothetical protein